VPRVVRPPRNVGLCVAYGKNRVEMALAHVDGWPIHLANLTQAISRIIERAGEKTGFCVFTLNVDHLVKLRTNKSFQEAYLKADFVTADGAPVAWLSRFSNAAITRTTGADLFLPLASAAADAALPVYLFGSSTPVLDAASLAMRKATRGKIKIAGLVSPSINFDPAGPEADAAIAAITASGAGICYVLLSSPKPEVFAARAVTNGCPAGFVCVGAAADFIAGKQVRAPQILQKYGLEWAWRLMNNPRRLAKRYSDCAAILFDVVFFVPLRQRLAAREI
jgi:exopolysaccharide biosynthesis WecB/TagA/CpsF family protein